MSGPSGTARERRALPIPDAWREFLSSGEYAGARASIRADGSEVPVDVVARVEFVDDRSLAIHLALTEGAPPSSNAPGPVGRRLTARERTVITLIATGRETEEIAQTLHVSPSTVRTHVRNSMTKLGAHTRAQLVAVAMEGHKPLEMGRTDDGTPSKSST
ncbi:MAG TPA: helix-turn-helix transcriptional regulator [Solirubrobacteraceae bacterium]|nr:helix-turn-helix transcriptional regulator [Solirubrobacteraceae bacterium]